MKTNRVLYRWSAYRFGVLAMLVFAVISFHAYAEDFNAIRDSCDDCHGKNGVSQIPTIPTIAGLSEIYFSDSMAAYQEKTRPCMESEITTGKKAGTISDMCKAVADLDTAQIDELAVYYSEQEFLPAKQNFDAKLASVGKKVHETHCEKCHEDSGRSPDDDAGILAGQWKPYLKLQFDDFNSGVRKIPEKKAQKLKSLTNADIEALLDYYGSFR